MKLSQSENKNARRRRWAFLLLVISVLGCEGSTREDREEFSHLSQAIDGLRAAENSHKTQMIQPLRSAVCTSYCALRDQCIGAYEAHIRALDLIARARVQQNLDPRELDKAELTLERARDLATECAAEQARLRRQLSL